MRAKLTPLLAQYHRIKEQHRDALLLFRVGDFYEMFFDDAKVGAEALGLTLTSRPHGPDNPVPLAGVPVKSMESHVSKLVARGFKVAICEQLEQPRPGKPVVRRDVVEVITPGTLTRPGLLRDNRNNYLMALCPAGNGYGIAIVDVSTGDFRVAEITAAELADEIQKAEPNEMLVPSSWDPEAVRLQGPGLSRLDDYYFTEDFAFDKLASHFGVATLSGFGVDDLNDGICAAGAALQYLEDTQRTALGHIRRLTPYQTADQLLVDRISRRNLELVEKTGGTGQTDQNATLYAVLNRTRTSAGARLHRRWILAPLVRPDDIAARHDAVGELLADSSLLKQTRELLSELGDLERVGSRVALERANARELIALANWLEIAPAIKTALVRARASRLVVIRDGVEDYSPTASLIKSVLGDDPPLAVTEGGIIRMGHNAELDELRELSRDAKGYVARLQQAERQRTGIPNLRVGYNSVFGYYIEVTKSYLGQVPPNYLRKQTLANAERFFTPELKEYESRIASAEERIRTLEYDLFVELRKTVGQEIDRVVALAGLLAELDVYCSFAQVASENGYVRPVVDESGKLAIEQGRHPVVEAVLDRPFIPNSTELDNHEAQIAIVTGPNMAGKSTYLRQTALIVIMAQAGSFVPAKSARVGVVDKIFTRIGASDDVSRGVSTFLAEMIETANILNNATSRSLVILDEVGRGTATNDGLAIAWAAVEHLHGPAERRPRTLFATHYHELTDIALLLPRVRNFNFSVREQKDRVLFLRKLEPGPADKSYGIAVARLAGLPRNVIDRAREVLAGFEQGERLSLSHLLPGPSDADSAGPGRAEGLQLKAAERPPHPVLLRLRDLEIERLSPLQALNLLAELQRLAETDESAT
ncbi:MAG: DNA mismatch repair protein MutS [candidate division WOR-3 bacterium]|nr:MAG: DNA mismatch repair protein MutS [candidate division WOR-3 bacterium]